MRISRSNTKLIDVLERDAQGNPTGRTVPRPSFVAMTDVAVVAAHPDYDQFLFVPQYIDVVFAGDDPANPQVTRYWEFNAKAEYDARVGKYLARNA